MEPVIDSEKINIPIESFIQLVESLPSWMPYWIPVGGTLIMGLLACFFGYKLLKVVLFMLGLLTGLYAGLMYGPTFLENPNHVWIASAVLGLALGILMNYVYKLGVFAMSAYVGMIISMASLQAMPEFQRWAVTLVVIFVFGIVGLILQKWTIKAATATLGAWHVIQTIFFLLKQSPYLFPWEPLKIEFSDASIENVIQQPWYFWVAVLVFALLGLQYQFRGPRKKKKEE